jgi:hypothetical protein
LKREKESKKKKEEVSMKISEAKRQEEGMKKKDEP